MAETTQQSPWQRTRGIHREYARFYEIFGGGSVFLVLGLIGLLIFAESVTDYQMNTYTELLGVALTVLVLDRRAKHRADRERKEELIFLMGSEDNSTALNAVRLLRHKGLLEDGSLEDARLSFANLEGADLFLANMEGADLRSANLKGARLSFANMEGIIWGSYLAGITKISTLPDGSEWTPETDLTRFIDEEKYDY